MNLFSKITRQNPKTVLGKTMEKFKKELGPLSFILYMIPLIILILINEGNNPGTPTPSIYTQLIVWYFTSLFLIDKIKNKNVISQIIEIVICLPIYLSVAIIYIGIKIFINKNKYPNVSEEELSLFQRNIKLKKLKKKIKRQKYLIKITMSNLFDFLNQFYIHLNMVNMYVILYHFH
jgi:hypothetical protein